MVKTISASEARKRFGEISDEVTFMGVTYLVLKNNKPSFEITPTKKKVNTEVDPKFKADLDEFEKEYGDVLQELAGR